MSSVKQTSIKSLWGRVFKGKANSSFPATQIAQSSDYEGQEFCNPQPDTNQDEEVEMSYETMNASEVPANVFKNHCGPPLSNRKTSNNTNNVEDSFSDSDNGDVYEETEINEDADKTDEIYDQPPPELQVLNRPLPKPPSPTPSEECAVADLYDTIDENAQKRLRKLAERSSKRATETLKNVVEEVYEEFDENEDSECAATSYKPGSNLGSEHKIADSKVANQAFKDSRITAFSSDTTMQRCESISPPYTPPPPTPPQTPPPSHSPSPPPPPPPPRSLSQSPTSPSKHPRSSTPSPPPPPDHPPYPPPSPSPPLPSSSPSPSTPPSSSYSGRSKQLPLLPPHAKTQPPNLTTKSSSDSCQQFECIESQSHSSNSPSETNSNGASFSYSTGQKIKPTTPWPLKSAAQQKKMALKPPVLPKVAVHPGSVRNSDPSDNINVHQSPHQSNQTNQENPQIKISKTLGSPKKKHLNQRVEINMPSTDEAESRPNEINKPDVRPKTKPKPAKVYALMSSSPKMKPGVAIQRKAGTIELPNKSEEPENDQKTNTNGCHEATRKEEGFFIKETVKQSSFSCNKDKHVKMHSMQSFSETGNAQLKAVTDVPLLESSHCLKKLPSSCAKFDLDDTKHNTVHNTNSDDPVRPIKQMQVSTAGHLTSKPKVSPKGSMLKHHVTKNEKEDEMKERGDLQSSIEGQTMPPNTTSTKGGAIPSTSNDQTLLNRPHQVACSVTARQNPKESPPIPIPVPNKKPLPPLSTKKETTKMNEQRNVALNHKSTKKPLPVEAIEEVEKSSTSPLITQSAESAINMQKPLISPKPNILLQRRDVKDALDIDLNRSTDCAKKSCTKKPPLPQKSPAIHFSLPRDAPIPSNKVIAKNTPKAISIRSGMLTKNTSLHECNSSSDPESIHRPASGLDHCVTQPKTNDAIYYIPILPDRPPKSMASLKSTNIADSKCTAEKHEEISKSAHQDDTASSPYEGCSFDYEIPESVPGEMNNEDPMDFYEDCSPQEPTQTTHSSYLEQSGGHKQGAQKEPTTMLKELSTVLLTMNSKAKATHCIANEEKHHKAANNSQSFKNLKAQQQKPEGKNACGPPFDQQFEFSHGSSKSVAAKKTSYPAQRLPMADSEVYHKTISHLSSIHMNKPSIKPNSVHPSKCETSESFTTAVQKIQKAFEGQAKNRF